ncbi:ABC transporter ATP-binding protein [Roseobacter weihaiensis]|uniref:ABC transporter ATP-binding protein n=1 Tax=Roseobacter weihaiensis TaxID=2763262 RepID=UPI001D0A90FF|nr:ABC transporter ATP-binding protein [Roseobacter sp. H9]
MPWPRKGLANLSLHRVATTSDDGSAPALLSVRRVTKSFGALVAVNKMSFDISPGTVFGIGGPNGAGKTTMFDVISGVQPANSGEILFDGQVITQKKPHEICHAGIARTFQLNAAFETMTVLENVLISTHHGHDPHEIPSVVFRQGEQHDAFEALELVGLQDRQGAIVSSLTLMEQKLLMIASAIATRPKLLLLDEPVGGLIPREIGHVENLIGHLTETRGMSVILIEHVMRFLIGLSDEVMIMNYGEKLYQGSAEGLTEDTKVVEVYLGHGASAQYKKKGNGQDAEAIDTVLTDPGEDEISDKWSDDVTKAARQVLRMHRSGKLYPIDYLSLQKLLEARSAEEKSTRVSRAARGLLEARAKGAPLKQHFELLERMLDEAHETRVKPPKPEALKGLEQRRADLIETAARRLIDAQDGQSLSDEDLKALRAALMWDIALNRSPNPDGGQAQ